MTLFFDYTLSTATLNNSTTAYNWILDTNDIYNDNKYASDFVLVNSGVFLISTPFQRYRVYIRLSFVVEKQNATDANDNVLAVVGNSFPTSTVDYSWGSTTIDAPSIPFVVHADRSVILGTSNPSFSFAPVLLSGPAHLAYTLLPYIDALNPYTRLHIELSYS
jgi:hypothetical protein